MEKVQEKRIKPYFFGTYQGKKTLWFHRRYVTREWLVFLVGFLMMVKKLCFYILKQAHEKFSIREISYNYTNFRFRQHLEQVA